MPNEKSTDNFGV